MLIYIDTIAIILVTVAISQFMLHIAIKMLSSTNRMCISLNYRGKAIPAIGGIVFVPVMMVAILLLLLQNSENIFVYMNYLTLVLSMGFAGVLDDLIGDRKIKGIINHMKSAFAGTFTTGFLKAFIALLVSCMISLRITSSFMEFLINLFIMPLFANTLNLFDLRPGRAVKVFIAASFMLLAAAGGRLAEAVPLIILNLAAWIYIRYDLKEICMLGDTGANILGITLGYYSSLFLNFKVKLLLITILLFLNIISERVSFTEVIEGSKLLSYLDGMGRRQAGGK